MLIDIKNLDRFFIDDYIKDIMIGFYQHLFSQNEGEFKYNPNKELTRINIADQFSVDDLTPEFKPTIYIRRHPFSFVNTSIDQLFGGTAGMPGSSVYTDLIAGSVEVVCVSSVELEAARLASIVFMLTNAFKTELRSGTGLFRVDVKTLGQSQPLMVGAVMKAVEVPVLIQLMFQSTWMISPTEEQQLKEVLLGDVIPGRSTDPITGERLKGIASDGCGNTLGEKEYCVPMAGDFPKPDDTNAP